MSEQDFNYSGAPDANDPVSLIRFRLGDTDERDVLLTDSEILTTLDLLPTIAHATLWCAKAARAKLARRVTTDIGSVRIETEAKFRHYDVVVKDLEKGGFGDIPGGDGSGPTLGMFVGGTSRQRFIDSKLDEDRVQPAFEVGVHDNPGAPTEDDSEWGR